METQVQWLLGRNYTSLTEGERPLECVQEPGDVVYLPDGWLHATVSIGPTVVRTEIKVGSVGQLAVASPREYLVVCMLFVQAFTRNSYDSSELPPPLGHYYHLDQFAIAVQVCLCILCMR